MNNFILSENEKKRQSMPLSRLICFAMFTFWQMGFIYFMGPSLTIDGRTPLPVSMDNITVLIAISYVLSIICMSFISRKVVISERILCVLSLVTALAFFLPLPDNVMRIVIYSHVFFCCFMIGFETFIMVNFLKEESVILHLTLAYGVALVLISIVQNDFIPISFPLFRFATVIAVGMLLYFCMKLPSATDNYPRYVRKSDNFTPPRKLISGVVIFSFISALMAVSGPSISGEIKNGVFVTYLVDALVSLLVYMLYKKKDIHPFRSIPICIALGAFGFLLMYTSTLLPALKYVACALIGCGMMPCQLIPLVSLMLMKVYPSRWISPSIIGLALVAVLVQSSMVEFFRNMPNMLFLAYSVIMVAFILIYLQLEPHLMFAFRKRIEDSDCPSAENIGADSLSEAEQLVSEVSETAQADGKPENPLMRLSRREIDVVNLICYGYSNNDIAKMLFISEHTVKDHNKNIYKKLDVHSRFELTALVNRIRENEDK
ncbi:MAG: helix-turn-helix transcriptional regulator [Clostridia bacterium]|nr:helix-turn-helix transcriptional regulator [Clostridia bacterium]